MIFEDGKGTGNKARVDANNRLHVQSNQETEELQAIVEGDGYTINTGELAYTAAGTMLFISNNEDKDLVVSSIAVGLNNLGTHSDIPRITVERNTTGGDLGFSDNTAVAMNANRNFGSAKTLTADVYAGKSGGTSTGGTDAMLFFQGPNGRLFATINLIVPKGQNIAITIDPKLSSGTLTAYAAAICYLKDPENQ